ncbi:hypothetical protein T492DRAFT_1030361 [Pavlovales sp. CCMP2436]|nr:hypothetical protein T492DRAFT_1030361 [Pavlovales sp. CCMP2436]
MAIQVPFELQLFERPPHCNPVPVYVLFHSDIILTISIKYVLLLLALFVVVLQQLQQQQQQNSSEGRGNGGEGGGFFVMNLIIISVSYFPMLALVLLAI